MFGFISALALYTNHVYNVCLYGTLNNKMSVHTTVTGVIASVSHSIYLVFGAPYVSYYIVTPGGFSGPFVGATCATHHHDANPPLPGLQPSVHGGESSEMKQ